MADRIKGITIEIGGNTTKLTESLKNVNSRIKETQTQLKDVDKLLKLDPKNVELLGQKQKLLADATEQTKEKLDALKNAQEQLNAQGVDKNSAEYMALSREIEATSQEMRKLEDATKQTNDALNKVSETSKKVADATGKLAEKTKGLSTASAGALGGLVALGLKSAKDADELNTLAKKTGLSTEALQKMGYASDLIDVDVSTITGAVTKMKKQLDSGADKFEAIGVSIKEANGDYRDTEAIFNDVIKALGQIEDETERDIVAMDFFGKSADELAGLIDDGGEALRRLGAEAEKNGAIISQEDLDKANELQDKLDELKARLTGSLGQTAVKIGETLAPVLEKVADVIANIAQHLAELSPNALNVIMIILSVLAVLSPLLGLISSIATVVPILATAIGAISAPMLAIVGVVGAVIAVGVLLYKNWDTIKAKAIELKNNVAQAFTELKNKVTTVFDNIKTAITDKFNNAVNTVKGGIDKIKGFFSNLKLELPKIKLPHFKLEGTLSLDPPSVPSIGIEWYKKAYNEAYLLNSPTIFGASGGKLLAGGEGNGSEAVVGTTKLMSMISEAMGEQRVNVSVYLEGDASQLFKLNRQENNKFVRATGYRPLA